MNPVDHIFRMRDKRVEKHELPIILPEDEHKKHQKDGTLNLKQPSLAQHNSYTIFSNDIT